MEMFWLKYWVRELLKYAPLIWRQCCFVSEALMGKGDNCDFKESY